MELLKVAANYNSVCLCLVPKIECRLLFNQKKEVIMGLPRYVQWFIIAKRETVCSDTGEEIKVGDKVLYIPKGKSKYSKSAIYSKNSKSYKEAEEIPGISIVTGHKC